MIHLFGCSFTAGSGLIEEEVFGTSLCTIGTTKYSNYTWDKELARLTGLNVQNHAEGGSSNERILNRVLHRLEKLKRNDTVIIGITSPLRLTVPFKPKSSKHLVDIHLLPEVVDSLQSKLNNKERVHWSGCNIDTDYAQAITDYYMYVMSNYEQDIDKDYRKRLQSLQIFLNNMGIRCIVWDYYIWGVAETIFDWSNGKFKDYHWSPNGHRYIASLFYYSINNNINYLDLNRYYRVKKGVINNYEYINYTP